MAAIVEGYLRTTWMRIFRWDGSSVLTLKLKGYSYSPALRVYDCEPNDPSVVEEEGGNTVNTLYNN